MLKFNRLLGSVGLVAALLAAGPTSAANITGAGATFPYPIYAKWAEAYKAQTGVGLNYQSIGSGGGIKQITKKTVNFGATDKPLNINALGMAGLTQFPTVMGGVVPVINVEGVAPGQLKLTAETLADIFLGKITKWNDPKLAVENKDVALPDAAINVVHRSDGSGTTYIFVHYLTQVNSEWRRTVGADASVAWPTGMGGKGNEGVASNVKSIKNSIGYVEYAYAQQNKMTYVQMKNRDGHFVNPSDDAFQASAANAKWKADEGFELMLTNQPGKDSWPISGATFILIHTNQANANDAMEVLKFFDWAFANGDQMATDLNYVPMPDNVVKLISNAWKAQIKDAKGAAIWK
ncbi:MAG: phosphate ABC transporter substrate-binding protein PstS [Gallionellaceae bacterium]|jgi:phosphate transport system substrate-binding protein